MQYYGTKLSENISRREPEGYLLCLNVPVARTGVQEYLPEELGLEGSFPVSVFRYESEVFSAETIASFEGMPVTNNHPPDGVTVENIRSLQKGHAHNVRRGSGDESDLLLADLIITDEALIEAILAGKREISCGYTYELCEENGQYIQRQIRGNHVAVVDAGRAGHRVSIRDRKPEGSRSFISTCERRTTIMKKSLLKKLTRMAKDGDPEAIEALAEAVEEIVSLPEAEAVIAVAAAPENEAPSEPAEPAGQPEPAEPAGDAESPEDEGIAGVISRLNRIIALLSPAEARDEDPEEISAESVERIVEEVVESGETNGEAPAETAEKVMEIVKQAVLPEPSSVLEPDGEKTDDCGPKTTGDALRSAIRAVRPALIRMTPGERRQACADIAAGMKLRGSSVYGALAADAFRRGAGSDPADLGRRIMANRNVNFS